MVRVTRFERAKFPDPKSGALPSLATPRYLVGMDRLELSTSRLSVARSGLLSYTPICMVLTVRLELTLPCGNQILSLARLPIPPREHLCKTGEQELQVQVPITTALLRNSSQCLLDWLDLSEEYIGGTLGQLQLPLPHADPLLPPQLVGAIYSRYVRCGMKSVPLHAGPYVLIYRS